MDVKRLLADIQRDTGTRLDESDPVLAAAVVNERLLAAALADLRKVVRTAGDQWAAQTTQNEESAKKVASKIITDASVWMGDRWKEAADAAAAKVVADIRAEIVLVEKAGQGATKAAYVSCTFGLVSTAIAVGLLAGLI